VYVCDTLGELEALYSAAGVAFVGGSLVPLGGHNLLEAARAAGGCAIVHGPHLASMREAAARLGATEPPASRQVDGVVELAAAVGALLADAGLRDRSRAAGVAATAELERGLLLRVWDAIRTPLGLPPLQTPTPLTGVASRL